VASCQSRSWSPANGAPSAITDVGRAWASAVTTAEDARGSGPSVSTTRAPAARAVARPASTSGPPVASTTVSARARPRCTAGTRRGFPAEALAEGDVEADAEADAEGEAGGDADGVALGAAPAGGCS